MNWKLTAVCVVLLLVCIFAAGCTGTDEPTATPTPTVVPTDAVDPNFSLVPGPIGTFPPGKDVAVEVGRDSNKPPISVKFVGGKGNNQIKDIEAVLYREEDKKIETFNFGKEPRANDEHIFEGSTVATMKDRVKVTAYYYSGEVVTFSDDVYEFRPRS